MAKCALNPFPVDQGALAELPEIPATLPQGNGENILVVDDEPAICASIQLMLVRLGYCVTTQINPGEALFEFRGCPDRFALVIADLNMPHLTGIDLAQQISLVRPQTPVLLSADLNEEFAMDKIRESGVHDVIAKPITPVTLAAAVHRSLVIAAEESLSQHLACNRDVPFQ